MAEHTPAPWTASHRHIYAGRHDDELDGLGWEINGPPEPSLRGSFAKAADAHLIAAAPDMYILLEGIRDAMTDGRREMSVETLAYYAEEIQRVLEKCNGR